MWGRQRTEIPLHTWEQETWEERVKAFLQTENNAKRFNWPFPMAVFGTLRKGQGNNRLMHGGKVEKHRLAFLPHFYAQSLSVGHKTNSTAPFEVFYYTPQEWKEMIFNVDCLESFDPASAFGNTNGGYYYRTLAWLRLLPEGYHDEWFPLNERADLWGYRDMDIDPALWNEFGRVPCWIYSNMRANKPASQEANSPIIWPSGK